MSGETKRLNKYLSEAGLCSRREADRLIEEGKIGLKRAGDPERSLARLGDTVGEGDQVFYEDRPVKGIPSRKTYLMLNKPRGIICTSDSRVRENVISFVGFDHRITYAGRLDKDTTGLLLLTDDGDLINDLMRSAKGHEKEYICTVTRPLTEEFIDAMSRGLTIEVPDQDHRPVRRKTRPCHVERLEDKTFRIVLTQGYNRQIRRMCETLGYKVAALKRVRILSLCLGDLEVGKWRHLTEKEVDSLKKAMTKQKK